MTIYNLGVALTTQEQEQYSYWSEVWTSCNARFGDDAALASSCIASKDNRLAYALSMGWNPDAPKASKDRWSPQVLGKAANMWLRAGNKCQEIVQHSKNKYRNAYHIAYMRKQAVVAYSDSTFFAQTLGAVNSISSRLCHGKLVSVQREVTTVKHYKTKPDVSTTKLKTIGAATLRKEAVEAFADPGSPVRVLCLSRLPDYDSRLRGAPLLINTSGNQSIVEILQPQVCVYLYCLGTYEYSKLLRKQRGQAITEITSINQLTQLAYSPFNLLNA